MWASCIIMQTDSRPDSRSDKGEQETPPLVTPMCFDHLSGCSGLVHGVFSRSGGVSDRPFQSLNLGLNCRDKVENVIENRNRMLGALGLSRGAFLNQVHGTDIHVLKQGMDAKDQVWDTQTGFTPAPVTADGLVTDMPDLALVIQVADCQAVLLFDPEKQVIANVHSGWRGSVANILGRCVDTMVKEFDCRPASILAGISPSLGPCCAEFINFKDEIPRPLWGYKSKDRPYFDFWQMSRDQLAQKGVQPKNIRQMDICTACNTDQFFSYRKQNNTGRFATAIALKGRS